MELKKNENNKKYISVLADGKFHESVLEGTEGAVVRTYEDKDGVKQSKIELVFDEAQGKITKFYFEDGEFGKNLLLEIDNDGIIVLGTASSFCEDLMKKLPAIDLKADVKLVPYSFVAEGKSRKGITVYQGEQKVESYYWDKEAKKVKNGFPEIEGDASKFDSDDWKMHFMKVRKFLVSEIGKLAIDF